MQTRKRYEHSAYWRAAHDGKNGKKRRNAPSYTGMYLGMHTYSPGGNGPRGIGRDSSIHGHGGGHDWQGSGLCIDSNFNPLLFGLCIAMDIGVAIKHDIATIADPVERERIKCELKRDLRSLCRPLYYARETERRRLLAVERRKVVRRRTNAPMPTPDDLREAWAKRKDSREAMIRLGGMLHDLDCYVDNCLKFDEYGNVAGRNGGIRGWLRECVPELAGKYKTLMRYKAMAVRLRQATGTEDPVPTAALLDEKPQKALVTELLAGEKPVFSHVFDELEWRLSPETVFLDKPKMRIQCGKFSTADLRKGLRV